VANKEIEEAHHLFFGAIKKMGEEFSWLVEAISTLTKAEGWPEQVTNKASVKNRVANIEFDFIYLRK
jgi:hypothetical protein